MTAVARDATMQNIDNGVKRFTWSGLDGDDTGVPVNIGGYNDVNIQLGVGATNAAGGIWGSATTVIQGTNDPRGNPNHADHANCQWHTMVDMFNAAISKTSAANVQLGPAPEWIRPSQSGGTNGNLAIVVKAVRQRGN